jgi:hypothetical protein
MSLGHSPRLRTCEGGTCEYRRSWRRHIRHGLEPGVCAPLQRESDRAEGQAAEILRFSPHCNKADFAFASAPSKSLAPHTPGTCTGCMCVRLQRESSRGGGSHGLDFAFRRFFSLQRTHASSCFMWLSARLCVYVCWGETHRCFCVRSGGAPDVAAIY